MWYLHIHLVCAKSLVLLAILITFPFYSSGLDTSIILRKGDCAISTYCTTRIAGGLLFRASPFFGTRKTPRPSTG